MSKNIVIGIGGTGAKVVEAIIHCTALGLGPSNLTVGLVDQDKSNGNVSRTQETLEAVSRARKQWRTSGSPHFVGDGDLLKAKIEALGEGLWVPHHKAQASLVQILGFLGNDEAALDLLFAKGPLEQEMRLDEGYRGRAHIGSAAITSAAADNPKFWRDLGEEIANAKGGDEVRILLVGSVFGGTGAAGFPTISRLVRRVIETAQIDSNIQLGGVLMLPYFRFSAPEDAAANVARTEDLLPQTRGALRYYHSLFEREKVFDELFLVGWNPSFDLGYHEPGTGQQRNPALLPELFAALGGARFFNPNYSPTGQMLVSARETSSHVGWSDLPSPRSSNPDLPYEAIGRHLRFIAAWKLWKPILSREAWEKEYLTHSWFKKQRLNDVDFANEPGSGNLDALDGFLDASLEWLASMKAYAQKQDLGWSLWNTDPLIDGEAHFETPTSPINIKNTLSDGELNTGWPKLIESLSGAEPLHSASHVHYRMNTEVVSGQFEGLGQFMGSLHHFCSVRKQKGER